jgi:hypothetical protein
MKPIFVKTKNVKGFINLIHNLKNKPDNISKIGLVYGNAGLGKTKTAIYLSIQFDTIYIIKYFQNEGFIDKTCIFEVKRIANIPKRERQVLSPEQLVQLFKITNKKYPYLTQIIQNVITLKQPLNTILTGSEQYKKSLKRKIRKDFYKIKQEIRLENYKLDDLRLCN